MSRVAVILLAAGSSSRFKGKEKKQFADLGGRAVWLRSLELFSIRDDVAQILIAVSDDDKELFDRRYRANVAFLDTAKVVSGGNSRAESVQNCLAQCKADIDLVCVHDSVRPCVTREQIDEVIQAAEEKGAAILAAPLSDTLKRAKDHQIEQTLPRDHLWLAQTPQVFRRELLLHAYANAGSVDATATDCSSLVEALGETVTIVPSDGSNIKVTTSSDLRLASAIIKSRPERKAEGGFHPFGDEKMWG